MSHIRIDHDDNVLDIIAKINRAMKPHGLSLVDDEEQHDGFMVLEVEKDGETTEELPA